MDANLTKLQKHHGFTPSNTHQDPLLDSTLLTYIQAASSFRRLQLIAN